jgi:hypothetical protein
MKLRNKEIIRKFRKLRSGRNRKHAVHLLEKDYGLHGSTLRRMLHANGAWLAVLVLAVCPAFGNTFYLQAAGCAVAPHDTAQVLVEAGADSGICTFVKGTLEYDSRQFRIVGVSQIEPGSITWSELAPTYCGDDATFTFFIDGMAFAGVRPVAMLRIVPLLGSCQTAVRWSCGNPPGVALIEILAEGPHTGAWNRTDPNLRVRDAWVTTTPCAGVGVKPASLGLVKGLYR